MNAMGKINPDVSQSQAIALLKGLSNFSDCLKWHRVGGIRPGFVGHHGDWAVSIMRIEGKQFGVFTIDKEGVVIALPSDLAESLSTLAIDALGRIISVRN
jgi:hypothetical protein